MKRLTSRTFLAIFAALSLTVLAIVGRAMAEPQAKDRITADHIHYFIKEVTPGTPDKNDCFMIVVTVNHAKASQTTTITGNACVPNVPPKPLPAPRHKVRNGKAVVAIFEFQRSDLPAGFDAEAKDVEIAPGTGSYTFTVTDPIAIPRVTTPSVTMSPYPFYPCP